MVNAAAAELTCDGIGFKPCAAAMRAKPIDKANAIVMEASLEMPFSPKVAYDAFSDFSRHSDWNPGVTSVEYVDPLNREARWTMEAFAGLKIDWHTVPTVLDPNKAIAWKSIKGMQLEGQVHFTPIADGGQTLMVLTSSYVVPRMMRRFFGKAKKGKKESNQVKDVLEKFRDVVSQEQAMSTQ